MEKNALIIHGFGVTPAWHWYAWAKQEIEQQGYHVDVPAMPQPLHPDCSNWVETIMEYIVDPASTILCGHSLGALAVLHYLNVYGGRPFKKVILLSTPLFLVENDFFAPLRTYIHGTEDLDWEGIRAVSHEFVVVHGSDDLFVPEQQSHILGEHLGVQAKIISGGHFQGSTFPELLSYFA